MKAHKLSQNKIGPIDSFFIFLLLLFSPSPLQNGRHDLLFIWNVGQGSWVTYRNQGSCSHVDMGGEHAPILFIRELCKQRSNILALSHTDFDHIKFVTWGKKNLPNYCILKLPRESIKPNLNGILNSNFLCSDDDTVSNLTVNEINFSIGGRSKNDMSRVYTIISKLNSTLLPGDSTAAAERIWQKQSPLGTRTLVLGHHGSLTSTSEQLIFNLPNLKIAISSARKKKYGHPHPLVVERLRAHGVAVLRTEIWGTIGMDI